MMSAIDVSEYDSYWPLVGVGFMHETPARGVPCNHGSNGFEVVPDHLQLECTDRRSQSLDIHVDFIFFFICTLLIDAGFDSIIVQRDREIVGHGGHRPMLKLRRGKLESPPRFQRFPAICGEK